MIRSKTICRILIAGMIALVSCEVEVDTTKSNSTGRFVKFYGGEGSDLGFDAIELTQGGYACIGSTESFSSGGTDILLVITDENGNEITDRITFGNSLDDVGRSIIQNSNGNLVIVGDRTDTSNNNIDIWMCEVDLAGNILNQAFLGDSGFEERGFSVLQSMLDDGYIISGTRKENGSSDVDSFIIKLDVSLNVEWTNGDGLLNLTDEAGLTIIETLSGDYIYASTSQRDVSSLQTDMRLTSLNDLGQLNWNFFYGENSMNEMTGSVSGLGNLFLVGSSIDPGTGNSDVKIFKTSLAGTELDSYTLDFGDEDLGKAIAVLRDGNIVVASESFTNVLNGRDIFLTKLSESGDALWDQSLILGGEGDDIASKVFEASDGGIVVFGTISFSGNPMMLLYKTDQNGKLAE